MLGGWLGSWSQIDIDKKFDSLKSAHDSLGEKIKAAKSNGAELSDPSSGAKGLAAAQKVFDEWDKEIEWTEGDKALTAIKSSIADIDGVASALSSRRETEVATIQEEVGKIVASALLDKRTPVDVLGLITRVGADALKSLSKGGLKKQAVCDLLVELSTDELLKTLAPLGGKRLQSLFEEIPQLDKLAKDSTDVEVSDVLDRLSNGTISKLAAKYTATTLKAKVLDPLGEKTVELIAAALSAAEIGMLLDTLGAARVGQMVGNTGSNRVAEVFQHRARLVTVSKALKDPDSIVGYWNGLKMVNLQKLWESKPDKEVAAVLDGVGLTALNSLLPSMSQAELFDHAARLGIPGLKGFGEAMKGSELVAITKPPPPPVPVVVAGPVIGGVPAPVQPLPKPVPAAPSDALLKDLGTKHAATLKAATAHFGNIATLNLVLRRCAQHLDATKTAAFLVDAVAQRWHDQDRLEEFFDLAGANIEARVTLAKRFVADGNDGQRGDYPGEGDPATAVHSKLIDGLWWTVAEGDIKHYLCGHTYAHYAMTDSNASRGTSSMWPTGTTKATVSTDAKNVLESAGFEALVTGVTAGFVTATINGFFVGAVVKVIRTRVPPKKRGDVATYTNSNAYRISQFYPSPGTPLQVSEMRAVAKLFQSKKT